MRHFDYLRERGEKAVFGQMVTFESRRGAKVLERYGFRVIEKREITKWRDKHPEPVYLTTVIKELSPSEIVGETSSGDTAQTGMSSISSKTDRLKLGVDITKVPFD